MGIDLYKNGYDLAHKLNYPMPSPDNYIYFFHTGDYIILPTWPDQISDSMNVNYTQNTPLGRSAPIYSYVNSGPRSLLFTFILHRDMMWELNYETNSSMSDMITNDGGDDYVDIMAKRIQGAALPEYSLSDKMVNPPIVAVKIGSEVYIKGVVTGAVGVNYKPPILRNNRYACIDISFTVSEVVPYSAKEAILMGSYRNKDYTLDTNKLYTIATGSEKSISSTAYDSRGYYGLTDEEMAEAKRDHAAALLAEYFRNGNIGVD